MKLGTQQINISSDSNQYFKRHSFKRQWIFFDKVVKRVIKREKKVRIITSWVTLQFLTLV